MIRRETPTHVVELFIAGDRDTAIQICRRYCMDVGLCVTIDATEFVYSGGAETGVRIGLTNYPRFPATGDALWDTAEKLAHALLEGLCQWSVLIRSPARTLWLSRRENG